MEERGMALDGTGVSGLLEPAREMLSRYGKMKVNVAEAERWGSVALGSGLLLYGLKRRSWSGFLFGLVGGGLLLRGFLGKSVFYRMIGINTATGKGLPGQADSNGLIRVDKSMVIDRSAEDLFRFLRDLENLPRIFGHLRSVRSLDSRRSAWTAKMPAGLDLEWESEVWEERENRKMAWRASAERRNQERRLAGSGSPGRGQDPGGRASGIRSSRGQGRPGFRPALRKAPGSVDR